MKRLSLPLLAFLFLLSNVGFAQVQTNIPSNGNDGATYSCQLTVRDLVKSSTYSAKSDNNTTNNWLLIRVDGDEPSKIEQSKFRKVTSSYHDLYISLSKKKLPSSISFNGRQYNAQFVEKSISGMPVIASYTSKEANSSKFKIVVSFSSYTTSISLIEKIEYKVVNTRNNVEETKMMLSYFNYNK